MSEDRGMILLHNLFDRSLVCAMIVDRLGLGCGKRGCLGAGFISNSPD
jgi:hypothetical protein